MLSLLLHCNHERILLPTDLLNRANGFSRRRYEKTENTSSNGNSITEPQKRIIAVSKKTEQYPSSILPKYPSGG
jgi:hypothetical protein